jgi:2,3-bisphosphoglycerate-independent phosphoglycerate mutase
MSIMGYDPRVYYGGRSAIEAISMDIPIAWGEVGFRCNLITVRDGRMLDHSAGHISNAEARALIDALNENLGDDGIAFYPGVCYRHICKFKGHEDTLGAVCTPPHDIPGKSIADHLPHGPGSDLLRALMERSIEVLRDHPVNRARVSRGDSPATMIWLFWGSGQVPELPLFREVYGLDGAMTSGVDLLRGLAKMTGVKNLDIEGVTAGLDNDFGAQGAGALKAMGEHDLTFVHVEAPDEAGHAGSIDAKIDAIERVDEQVVGQIVAGVGDDIRMLVMPDHATPIEARTHVPDPVPFVLWGRGFGDGSSRVFSEAEAERTGILLDDGYRIMDRLARG